MGRETRADYDQVLLFPPCVEDWVGPDHPARFLRDFVDSLDLRGLRFRVPDTEVGRPGYASDLMLKVWLYGYFHRIRSTRKLEKACRENMGLIWLTGNHAPDHNSLWRFMDANKQAVSRLFKKSVQVASKCNLIGMVVHAIDGSKIRSATSRDGVVSAEGLEKMLEKLDRSIADFMTEIERQEREETGEYRLPLSMQSALRRKDRIQRALAELEESGRPRTSHREPEARFMKNRRSIEPSYNGQAVADRDHGIIVAQDVITDETDNGQLVPMLDKVRETLGGVAEENLADSGFYSSPQIGLAEERKYSVLVNAPSSEAPVLRNKGSQVYPASSFRYDEDLDCCICPHGCRLVYYKTRIKGANRNELRIYRCREHRSCPHASQCSKNRGGRQIEISVHHKAVSRQRAKREADENKKLLSERKRIIEPVFAWIKTQLGFDRWTVFGLERVRAQWAFVCTVINLKKLYRHWLSGELRLAAE